MTDTELCKYYGKLFFNSFFLVKSACWHFLKRLQKNRCFRCQKITQLLLASVGGAGFALQLVELRHDFETESN